MNDLGLKKQNIKKFFIYLFLLIPFFKILYLSENFNLCNIIYNYWIFFSSFIIFTLIFLKKKYSKIINYIIIFLIVLLISSIINNLSIIACIFSIINIIALCFLVDYGIRYDREIFLRTLGILLSMLIYLNFIFVLLYPNGMYTSINNFTDNWILGYKNTHILFIIPGILINFLYKYITKGKFTFSNYFLLCISFVSTYIVNNSTGLTGLSIIIIFLIFKKLFSNIKIFNIFNYFIVSFGLSLSIVVFRIQDLFSSFIINVLHKDITFTGRIYVWDKVLEIIKRKPIFGYGNVNYKYDRYILSTHNGILGIMHKTGFIGLISYIIILFSSFKELWQYRKTYLSKFVSIIILVYFIMMITEAYGFEYYFYIFIIAYDIKYLLKKVSD